MKAVKSMQATISSFVLSKTARAMTNLAFQAVAVDIDGTLLNDAKEIPLANKAALTEFRAAGGTVILVSGRLPISVCWHAELLELDAPFIAMNGAYTGQGRKMLTGKTFATSSVLQFLALCRQKQLYCHIYTNNDMYYDTPDQWNEDWTQRNFAWLEGQPRRTTRYVSDKDICLGRRVADLSDFVNDEGPDVYKLAVFAEHSLQDEWQAFELLPEMSVTSSDLSYNLEIMPAGVSKGSALLALANRLGIAAASILAIGDNYNDISMLQAAGFGVAMGNAPKAVQRQAKQITSSNNEAGVAAAVLRWAYAR
jgi:Cof subfamily protein (haloacid dehalogenase superfamily)